MSSPSWRWFWRHHLTPGSGCWRDNSAAELLAIIFFTFGTDIHRIKAAVHSFIYSSAFASALATADPGTAPAQMNAVFYSDRRTDCLEGRGSALGTRWMSKRREKNTVFSGSLSPYVNPIPVCRQSCQIHITHTLLCRLSSVHFWSRKAGPKTLLWLFLLLLLLSVL